MTSDFLLAMWVIIFITTFIGISIKGITYVNSDNEEIPNYKKEHKQLDITLKILLSLTISLGLTFLLFICIGILLTLYKGVIYLL